MAISIKAAIDIGTNSTRLLVAQIDNGKAKDLFREARVTRLGQNVDKTGMLADEAIDRTISALADYKNIASKLGAKEIIVGTTSAARDAKNVDVFIKKVKQKTSLDVKVLSSTEEATLSFTGATSPSPLAGEGRGEGDILVLDIGGGSTELILGDKKPQLAFSKDIGSVRLTELFIKHDPPKEEELNKITQAVTDIYQEAIEEIKHNVTFRLIGVAGTITTLAALNLQLEVYDSTKVHGSILTVKQAQEIFNKLKKLNTKERKALKTMQSGREDVIVAGALILLTIMKLLEVKELTVSEADILDGLLLSCP